MDAATVCELCGRPVELADVSRVAKIQRALVPLGVELPYAFEGSLVAVLHAACWQPLSGP